MSRDAYNIVIVRPSGYAHSEVFSDVARLLHVSLQSLGYRSQISVNTYYNDMMNLLLGYQMLAPRQELRDSPFIVFQLEQLTNADPRFDDKWLELLGMARMVWDYSALNVDYLHQRGINHVEHLPLGYHPALATIPDEATPDVDVLHYGSMNARRREVMLQLQPRCRLVHVFGVYGAQRDALIARSKIVLNLHMHDTPRFEQVRVSYLLNNGRLVVSEPAEDNPYGGMVVTARYQGILQTCQEYLSNPDLRHAAAHEATARFQSMRMEELLRPVLH